MNYEQLLGKTVYVSVNEKKYYRAELIGYGVYGTNPDHKTYCVKVFRDNGTFFIDYFMKITTQAEYEKIKQQEVPHIESHENCHRCGNIYSSIISQYWIDTVRYCPMCGEPSKYEGLYTCEVTRNDS